MIRWIVCRGVFSSIWHASGQGRLWSVGGVEDDTYSGGSRGTGGADVAIRTTLKPEMGE